MRRPARALTLGLVAVLAVVGLVLLTRDGDDQSSDVAQDEPGDDAIDAGLPPYYLYDADADGAIVVDERRRMVLGLGRGGKVVWRDRAAYSELRAAQCLTRCPDAVLSGVAEGDPDAPDLRDPPVRWHVGRGVRVDRHPSAPRFGVVAARSPSDHVAVAGDGVRFRLELRSPGRATKSVPVSGPLDSSSLGADGSRALVLTSGSDETSDRLSYRWVERGPRGWETAGAPGSAAFLGACVDPPGGGAVLVGEQGARSVPFGSSRGRAVQSSGTRGVGDCALGRGTLLTVVQRESAAGEDEAFLRFYEGPRLRWRTRVPDVLNGFLVHPTRPLVAVLVGDRLAVIGPDGRPRALRRGVSDIALVGERVAYVTNRGRLERVPFALP